MRITSDLCNFEGGLVNVEYPGMFARYALFEEKKTGKFSPSCDQTISSIPVRAVIIIGSLTIRPFRFPRNVTVSLCTSAHRPVLYYHVWRDCDRAPGPVRLRVCASAALQRPR